jgi:hypothetical protein
VLAPRLNEHLHQEQRRAESFKDRYEVALFVDRTTRNLGVCLTYNDQPALLAAKKTGQHGAPEARYTILQPAQTHIGFERVATLDELPQLTLVPAPVGIHDLLAPARREAHHETLSRGRK